MRKWVMIGSCVDYFNRTSLWWFCTNVTGGMNGAVFDVGRVSWFQRGLLNGRFSSIVVHKNYKRREFVQSWWGKNFSVPMWFSTSRLVPDCFAQMLQEKIVWQEKISRTFRTRRKVVQQTQPQYLITSNLIIFWACGKMWLF